MATPKVDPLEVLVRSSIKRLSEYEPGECESFLIYGTSGSGKTRLCGTAGSEAYYINIGKGKDTLFGPEFRAQFPNYDPIMVDLFEKLEAGENNHEYATLLDQIWIAVQLAFSEYLNQFKWLIIDDASELRKAAMNKAVEMNYELSRSQTMVKTREKHDVIVPEIGDYTAEMNFVEKFVADCISLCKQHNKHFVLTAHERVTYNKPARIGDPPTVRNIGPGFTGQTFPDAVPQHFNHVFRLEVIGGGEQRKRRLYVDGNEMMMAKTRWGGVFKVIEENPNLTDFIRRIKETKTPLLKRK